MTPTACTGAPSKRAPKLCSTSKMKITADAASLAAIWKATSGAWEPTIHGKTQNHYPGRQRRLPVIDCRLFVCVGTGRQITEQGISAFVQAGIKAGTGTAPAPVDRRPACGQLALAARPEQGQGAWPCRFPSHGAGQRGAAGV